MKRLFLALGLLWFYGCQTTELPGKVYFAVKLDATWSDADSITVAWVRQPGDTSLVHEGSRAKGEDSVLILADGYAGGATTLILRGFKQGGLIHFQVREYDGGSQTVSHVDEKDVSPPSVRIQAVKAHSIGDSVIFSALAEAHGKPLQGYAWDYQSDGRFDEGGILRDSVAPLNGGFRYAKAADYWVSLRITDAWGVAHSDSEQISIRQDMPTANAGLDLAARRLSTVKLRGKAFDTLGSIVKREWKIGTQGFQETDSTGELSFTVPDSNGILKCVFRATDDDGQVVSDTLELTLVAVSDPTLSPLLPADTTITIGDTLTWATTATPGTAGLASIAWDLGAGAFNSPLPITRGVSQFKQGLRFASAKDVTIRAKLIDSADRIANASAHVKVVIDSPKVNAGVDTLVPVGGVIRLHGHASDGLGDIVRTEWRIGGTYRIASPDTQFAAATPGVFDYVLRAIDDDGLVATDSVRVTVTASTSAALSELSLVGIPFDSGFLANRYIYSASVANSVNSVSVKASVVANSKATLKVKGMPLLSGSTTSAIALNVGTNLIDVQVTAQDTNVHQNYLISVTRAPNSNALLQTLFTSLGSVTPAFKDTVYSYTVQAPYRTRAITVSAAPVANTTELTLNGNEFAWNRASDSITLTGANTQIRIGTLAEAGNALTYTITVQRDTTSDELVSNFETRSALNSLGAAWNFFNDSPNGGNSIVLSGNTATNPTSIDTNSFETGYASSLGALVFEFRFGTIKPLACAGTCTFPNYVGFSTAFMPYTDSVANLTGATAITFYAKAETTTVARFVVKTKNVLDFGFYQSLVTVTTEWKKHTVYLRAGTNPQELTQPIWVASPAPFSIHLVTGLDIQFSAEENTTITHGKVWLDDVTIVGWRRP